jgi:hypothetical protein
MCSNIRLNNPGGQTSEDRWKTDDDERKDDVVHTM